ncbi:2Fe-2S iron-sulfur cluster-binding protein [Escherichia coli]|nr:2Fe-2S iron-sulfur cluster-binding protein [Escherichia coli]
MCGSCAMNINGTNTLACLCMSMSQHPPRYMSLGADGMLTFPNHRPHSRRQQR